MLIKEGKFITLTLDDIIQMTREVGEDWAVAHAKRLLELIKQIGAEVPYDPQVLELAAYLHDWGAFPRYIQRDVEHAVRSRQVVEREILPHLHLTAKQKIICLKPSNFMIIGMFDPRNRMRLFCYVKPICWSFSG